MAGSSAEKTAGFNPREGRTNVVAVALSREIGGRLRKACARNGWECVEISRTDVLAGTIRIPADVMVLPGAEAELLRRLRSEEGTASIPVLVVTPEGTTGVADLSVADGYIGESADDAAIAVALNETLRQKDAVEFVMRRVDHQARRLTKSEDSEWFRSRLGIVGVTRVPPVRDAEELREQLRASIGKAHALLDTLPEDQLSLEDLWNLLLFVAVPWNQEEAENHKDIMAVLEEAVQDTAGSRKIILWRGKSLVDHLGPMGRRGTFWLPSSSDPLRDALHAAARDDREREALEALFKAKISEADLDQIIEALGRKIL